MEMVGRTFLRLAVFPIVVGGWAPVHAQEAPAAETKEDLVKTGATSAKAATFKSKRLLHGKIALDEDRSKLVSVVFDESGGTRTGHDILYADVNFNGKFEEDEKLEAAEVKRYGTWLSTSTFTPVTFNVPYNEKAEDISDPCQVTLSYRQYPRAGVAEDFLIIAVLKLRENETVWDYRLSGSGNLSKRLEDAELWSMNVVPNIHITTRADERNRGNIGVGLELKAGETELECRKAGEPIKAHVEIKKLDGTVVHRGDATLDKFVFG
jgi:hypothetical protein